MPDPKPCVCTWERIQTDLTALKYATENEDFNRAKKFLNSIGEEGLPLLGSRCELLYQTQQKYMPLIRKIEKSLSWKDKDEVVALTDDLERRIRKDMCKD